VEDKTIYDIYIELSELARTMLEYIRDTQDGRADSILDMLDEIDSEVRERAARGGECFLCGREHGC
jgi:hypothetical protein